MTPKNNLVFVTALLLASANFAVSFSTAARCGSGSPAYLLPRQCHWTIMDTSSRGASRSKTSLHAASSSSFRRRRLFPKHEHSSTSDQSEKDTDDFSTTSASSSKSATADITDIQAAVLVGQQRVVVDLSAAESSINSSSQTLSKMDLPVRHNHIKEVGKDFFRAVDSAEIIMGRTAMIAAIIMFSIEMVTGMSFAEQFMSIFAA